MWQALYNSVCHVFVFIETSIHDDRELKTLGIILHHEIDPPELLIIINI